MSERAYCFLWGILMTVIAILFVVSGLKAVRNKTAVVLIPFMKINIDEIRNVKIYNYEISRIYYSISLNMLLVAFAGVISRSFGAALLLLNFFPGVLFIIRRYKKVLSKCLLETNK